MPDTPIADLSSAEQLLNRIRIKRAVNRRNFLSGIGITGAAMAGGVILADAADRAPRKFPLPVRLKPTF